MSGRAICRKTAPVGYHARPAAIAYIPALPDLVIARSPWQGPAPLAERPLSVQL